MSFMHFAQRVFEAARENPPRLRTVLRGTSIPGLALPCLDDQMLLGVRGFLAAILDHEAMPCIVGSSFDGACRRLPAGGKLGQVLMRAHPKLKER